MAKKKQVKAVRKKKGPMHGFSEFETIVITRLDAILAALTKQNEAIDELDDDE